MTRTSKRSAWPLLAILALALLLRVINLGGRTLWYDEAFAVLFADNSVSDMADVTLTAVDGAAAEEHPLLYYVLLKAWMSAAGSGPAAARFLSVLCGVATVGLVYGIARDWFSDERTAMAAALITAVAPFHVQYSQEARMYALMTLWLTLAAWSYARAWQRDGWRYWAGFAVLAALSMYTQQLSAFYLLALALLPVLVRDWRRLAKTAVAGLAATILYLPWLVHLPDQMGKLKHFWVARPSVLHFWLVLRSFISVNLDFSAAWWLPTFLMAAVLPVVLLVRARAILLRRQEHAADWQPVLWSVWLAFAPMVLMWGASYVFQPVFLPRALLPSAVMLYVGLAWLFTRGKVPGVIVLVLVAAWLPIAVFGLVTHYRWDTFPNAPFDRAAGYLRSSVVVEQGDVIVHANKVTALPMVYYDPDLPQRYVRDIPDSGSDTLARQTQQLLGFIADGDVATAIGDAPRVWYVAFEQFEDEMTDLVEDDPANSQYDSLAWLRAHYRLESVRAFNDLYVYRFSDRLD